MRDQTGQRPPVGAPLRHSSSPRTRLLRAGFQNVSRAGALLGDPALAPLLPAGDEGRGAPVIYLNGRQVRNLSELDQINSNTIKKRPNKITPI